MRLDRALYSFSGDPDDFDEIVDYDYQHANVSFSLRDDSTKKVLRVVRLIQDYAHEQFGQAAQHNGALHEPLLSRLGRWLLGKVRSLGRVVG